MVSSETKKRRRKEGQRRKKAARVEVPLPSVDEEVPEVQIVTAPAPECEPLKEVFQKLQAGAVDDEEEDSASESSDDAEEDLVKDPGSRKRKKGQPKAEADGLTTKQRRKDARYSVAQLKQLVAKPQLVEVHDPNSHDPRLLLHLKGMRNVVPIPQHWCQKRKYLSMKKASTKKPFELAPEIAELGVSRTRLEYLDKDGDKKAVGGGTRARVARIQVDFAKYERAFRKPTLPHTATAYGEIYFEGKEKEMRFKSARPGVMSERLRKAAGIPEGAPPPWLHNMQKYGPPASYPNLKLPGVSAPLPAGAQWGYHTGGWGKAPVDSSGVPIYGDVFGTRSTEAQNRALWGVMEADSEDEDSYDAEDMEGREDPTDPVEGAGGAAEQEAPAPSEPVKAQPAQRAAPQAEAPALVDLGVDEDDTAREAITVLKAVPTDAPRGSVVPNYRYDLGKAVPDAALPADPAMLSKRDPASDGKKDARKKEFKF